MANCPSCGCRTAEAARFCPMCGITINHNAVNARAVPDDGIPRRAEVPQPNEQLVESYTVADIRGFGMAKALRVLLAMLAVLMGMGSIIGGVAAVTKGSVLMGGLIIVLGLAAALLLCVVLYACILQFENIAVIARGTETQQRITAAQLELLSNMTLIQDECLRLNRQTVELLKVMDGDRFDAAKHAECQTAMLERMVEQQQEHTRKLEELKAGSETMVQLIRPQSQKFLEWKNESGRFARAVALAISQLPDRMRSVLSAEKTDAEELPVQEDDSAEGQTQEPEITTDTAEDGQTAHADADGE